MIDALGRPQRLLVVGATSDIGAACLRAVVARGGVESAVLTARDPGRLDALVAELAVAGVAAQAVQWDALAPSARAPTAIEAAWRDGDVDVVLVAAGVLPDEAAVRAEPTLLADVVQANYAGPATLLLHAAERLRAQGHGTLVVLSSVAAERPRGSNFVYASTKAALDSFASGLDDALAPDGVRVLVVRPGFVHSRMTQGLDPAPLATTPERVGEDVAAAIAARRSGPLWSPAPVRVLMSALRHLPRPVYRRVSQDR